MLKLAFMKAPMPDLKVRIPHLNKNITIPNVKMRMAHIMGSWLDHSIYSHGQLIFSDGVSGSAWQKTGVKLARLDYDDRWDFYAIHCMNEAYARAWFAEHEGYPYDNLGVMRFALGIFAESENKYFCWEAIAASFGWSRAWHYGPGATLARLVDDHCAIQVDSPW